MMSKHRRRALFGIGLVLIVLFAPEVHAAFDAGDPFDQAADLEKAGLAAKAAARYEYAAQKYTGAGRAPEAQAKAVVLWLEAGEIGRAEAARAVLEEKRWDRKIPDLALYGLIYLRKEKGDCAEALSLSRRFIQEHPSSAYRDDVTAQVNACGSRTSVEPKLDTPRPQPTHLPAAAAPTPAPLPTPARSTPVLAVPAVPATPATTANTALDDVVTLLTSAEELYREGNLSGAEQLWKKAIVRYPGDLATAVAFERLRAVGTPDEFFRQVLQNKIIRQRELFEAGGNLELAMQLLSAWGLSPASDIAIQSRTYSTPSEISSDKPRKIRFLVAPLPPTMSKRDDYIKPLNFHLRLRLKKHPFWGLVPDYAWQRYVAGDKSISDIVIAIQPRPDRENDSMISFYAVIRAVGSGREYRFPVEAEGAAGKVAYEVLADQVFAVAGKAIREGLLNASE